MNFITNVVHAAIKLDLATIVAASRAKPVWYEAFTKLSPESTGEERLAVYQAVRDSGCLPPPTPGGQSLSDFLADRRHGSRI